MIALGAICLWMPTSWALSNYLVVEKPLPKADAIIVLSGSTEYRDRTRKAAELYNQGVAPKVLLTNDGLKGGWNQDEQRNPYFVEREMEELVNLGVSKDAIVILPETVHSTVDEAQLSADFVTEKHLASLFIVTSAYHSRRALWTFDKTFSKNGLQIDVGIDSPPSLDFEPPAFDWWLGKRGFTIVISEYAKMIYHWVAG